MRATGVETVAQSFEAFNTRDTDRLVSLTHPHCEWFPFRAQLEGTSYQGHQGVRRFVRDMGEDWETFTIDPVELTARDDLVVVTGHVNGRSSATGVEIDFIGGFVFELRDELIMRIMSYSDPADAREAAGLDA
ncbi:MAG: nuclear transport factor 2 family protein [Thermoleophilaceae bacterium]|nr:nuclear transport factor 2 family protein [Thermoleophilaceae bacterium]